MTQSALINVMSAAAIKAGKGLLRDFGEVDQLQISRKGTSNFVTQSDIRTEKLLQRELSKARPEFGFLLEEGGEVPGRDPGHRFIIDPLDGTSNFIHAMPYFCISIALEKRDHAGRSDIIAGVIFDPIHNELFSAEKGKGAQMNGRKLSVSGRDDLEHAMVVTGSPRSSMLGDETSRKLFDSLVGCGATVRHFGATALDLANLAAGRFDACWYSTNQPWDLAAGLLLVREAGGIFNDGNGNPVDCYTQTLLATNSALHLPIQRLLTKAA
jgi:myo-inositol-1(or 4)-monophosphatase